MRVFCSCIDTNIYAHKEHGVAYQQQPKKIVVPASQDALCGSKWLEQNSVEIYTKYPDEWVAASTSGLVAHNPSLDEVLKEVETQGLRPEDVAVRYTETGVV